MNVGYIFTCTIVDKSGRILVSLVEFVHDNDHANQIVQKLMSKLSGVEDANVETYKLEPCQSTTQETQ